MAGKEDEDEAARRRQEDFRRQVYDERAASFEHALGQALGAINKDAVDTEELRRNSLINRIEERKSGRPLEPFPQRAIFARPPMPPREAPIGHDEREAEAYRVDPGRERDERIAAEAEALGSDIQDRFNESYLAHGLRTVGESVGGAGDTIVKQLRPGSALGDRLREVELYEKRHPKTAFPIGERNRRPGLGLELPPPGPKEYIPGKVVREDIKDRAADEARAAAVAASRKAAQPQAMGSVEFRREDDDKYPEPELVFSGGQRVDPVAAPPPPAADPSPAPAEEPGVFDLWKSIQAFRNGRTGR